MAKEKAPAFQMYPRDWDTDINVIPMTYEEEGVYFAICRLIWLHEMKVSADLDELRLLLKGQPALDQMNIWWKRIGKCFTDRGGFLQHKRLNEERRKQATRSKSQSRNGKKGGRPKATEKPRVSQTAELSKPKKSSASASASASADLKESDAAAKSAAAHPIKDLLAFHEQVFVKVNHGEKPAKYTGADAKAAKDLIDRHGYDKARLIVRQGFVSTDKFIAESGRSMGFIASSSVQNRLIAELAAKKPAATMGSTAEHPHLKKLAEMGVTHG